MSHSNPKFHLRLLGRPSLVCNDRDMPLPEKSYFLLAILALAPGTTLDRETLRRLLWSSGDAEKRANSLRQLLARVMKVIGPRAPEILFTDGEALQLRLDYLELDVLTLFEGLSLGERDGALLHGELLSGVEAPTAGAEDWLSDARRKVADYRASAIVRLLRKPGIEQLPVVLELANRLIDLDPSQEEAARALMDYHARRGDLASARQAYARCRDQLREDFRISPSQGTIQLARNLGILGNQTMAHPGEHSDIRSPKPEQPRVVILPPETLVQDPLVHRLGRALLEDVTIGLSHQRVFKIIAAHTSFELANRAEDARQLQASVNNLQFDYSVYVTLQGEGDDFFATCRLTKVTTGEVLWAIDLPLNIQRMSASFSQLARRIATSLTDVIERHEMAIAIDDIDPSAYRLYLEGKRYLSGTDLQDLRQARKWFKSAVKRCDSFSPAHAGISRSLGMEWLVRGMKDSDILDVANQHARTSRDLDPSSGRAFRELGFISLYRRRFDESLDFFQKAQDLNPSDADILVDFSDALSHAGDLDKALELGLAAFKLNPLPPDYYYWILGSTYFIRQEYTKAIETVEPVKTKHATARLMAASHAMSGDLTIARKYAATVRENFPDFRSEDIRHFVPDRDPAHAELLIKGLQLAGLP